MNTSRIRKLVFVLTSAFLLMGCLLTMHQQTAAPEEIPTGKPDSPTPGGTTISTHPPSSTGTTYFIRVDGGSFEECDGQVNAAYPGSGTDQPCAWNHPFQALPPDEEPRIAGGDTLVIENGSYQMGYGAPGTENCDYEGSYDCHMSPIPSGPDTNHPTRILGSGWDTGCSQAPELWGTGRAWFILNLTGSSNVELACMEITDHSSCIEDHLSDSGGSPFTCQRDNPPYGDWASVGLYAEDAANIFLNNLTIHGLANSGIVAGRMTDWTVENIRIIGNGLSGWNGDLVGDGTQSENHGTMTFRNMEVTWNGCGESYPEKQHTACWGQEAGGYGDGFAMGTTGAHWIFENCIFSYNTSDGLDMLYARLPDAKIDIYRTIAEGNDGNQIKTTGAVYIENSIITSHCSYFHGIDYWNNDDDCRAGGDALVFALQPGGSATVINTTITSEGTCLVIAECALDKTCNGEENILLQNTLFQGQKSYYSPDEDVCFAWYDDESYSPLPANPFIVKYSLITGVHFGNVDPCDDPDNLCVDSSGISDPAIDTFDAHLTANSPAINAGSSSDAPTDDFNGHTRDEQPDIGAYEYSGE